MNENSIRLAPVVSDIEKWQYRGWLSCHTKTFQKICEFFETTTEHNSFIQHKNTQGILLCGPSGIGKTFTVSISDSH